MKTHSSNDSNLGALANGELEQCFKAQFDSIPILQITKPNQNTQTLHHGPHASRAQLLALPGQHRDEDLRSFLRLRRRDAAGRHEGEGDGHEGH